MKHLKLTLFLVALMSLCPGVAYAWQTISGSVNVSSLTDQRILLNGNVTITVDQDWYLREISGVYSVLTIIINSNCTLTVDQNNSNVAAIDVASLRVTGSGDLLCTGRNYGAYIRAGYLKVYSYSGTASFHGRDSYASHGVWFEGGGNVIPVTISSGTVNFQANKGYAMGGNGSLTVTGNNTVVNISSNQDGINFESAGYDGAVNVTGGSLNVYGKRYAIYCQEVNLNAGSSLEASNGDSYAAVRVIDFNATNCYANVTSGGNGIEATYLTAQGAEIHAYGGNRAYGLYARTKAPGTLGADGYIIFKDNSRIYADGYYGGIRSEANISIENWYLYAKARASGCSAVSAVGDLKFYTTPSSVYEAYSASYPFFADGQIIMYQPFNDRFSGINSMLRTTSRYDVSSDQHHFITYAGSGTNTTPALGYVCIKGTWLTETNVNMSETLWAKYNGYYQSRPVAAYKGEEVMFMEPAILNDYVLHNPTNNPATIYPNPEPVRTVEWFRVDDTGLMRKVGTGDIYTPTADDVGYRLKAMVSYSSHQGGIYSNDLPVVAKQNNNEPIQPSLHLYSSSSTKYVYVNPAYVDQEYIVMTTKKEISDLTESDWANALSPSSQGSLRMCVAELDNIYYVYTRFKETDTYGPGTRVKYSSISGGTTVNTQGVKLTATTLTGASFTPDDMGYLVPKNTVVKLTLSPLPSNATDFQGATGSSWRLSRPDNSGNDIWSNECGGLYANSACTQSLVANQYYKTVYAKLTGNRDQQYFGNAYVFAGVTGGYYDQVYFVVSNDNGTWDPFSIDLPTDANQQFKVTKGCSVTNPFTVHPAVADLSNLTVEFFRYFGDLTNPTPPTVTINKEDKTFTISTYEATADNNGRYRFNFKVGNITVAYMFVVVEKRPVESITVSPHEATLDPLVGQLQLETSLYPEYAEADVVWASSAPSIIAVNENGLVTLANANSALGETYFITATANGFTDTCVVHVGGEKYQLWVRNTQVNSLNQLDILGMGNAIIYSNGVLTLNGVTLGSTTYAYPVIRSEMTNLTINLVGANKATANNNTATIWSTGNLTFTGDGSLNVQNRNTSTSVGIAAKILEVTGTAQVTVSGAALGVVASNGLSVAYGAQLRSKGFTASVNVLGFLDGVIAEPTGAAWNTRTGYVTDRASGVIVANDYVTILGEEPEPQVLLGDVNDDGLVNITDVTVFISAMLSENYSSINLANADMNGDGLINITDITILINEVTIM